MCLALTGACALRQHALIAASAQADRRVCSGVYTLIYVNAEYVNAVYVNVYVNASLPALQSGQTRERGPVPHIHPVPSLSTVSVSLPAPGKLRGSDGDGRAAGARAAARTGTLYSALL